MEKLFGRYQEFLTFAMMKRHDIKTFFHVLNVSLLSMFFSSKLGFSKEEIIEIGTAALFHDIGKLYISKKIIQKPERLTQSEFFAIKNHVIIGTEILLKYVDTLGMLPLVVCFEHHLKFDLSGYPKVSFYKEPHIVSQIVSLCDIYDALSQRRGYKADYPPESIYKIILRERGTSFNPELFDSFFRAIGVWPVGTIVALSDERVAVVRKENDDDIFSPEVEVVYPPEQKELVDLRRIKERCKIEQSLNPLTDGKRFLYLV
jgi:HD-GYP domain-containing protein (c-di-GMP phosphodiesterase class II)